MFATLKKKDWCQSVMLAVETGTLQTLVPLPLKHSQRVNACLKLSPWAPGFCGIRVR